MAFEAGAGLLLGEGLLGGAEAGLLGAGAIDLSLAGEAGAFAAGGLSAADAAALYGGGAGLGALAGEGAFDVAGLGSLAGGIGAVDYAPFAATAGLGGGEVIPAAIPTLSAPASLTPAATSGFSAAAGPGFEMAASDLAGVGFGELPGVGGSAVANTDVPTLAKLSADVGSGGAAPAGWSSSGAPEAAAATQTAQTASLPTPAAPSVPSGGAVSASPAAVTTPPAAAGGGISDWISKNPVMAASLGLGGAMLAKNAIAPPKLPNQKQLDAIAAQSQSISSQNQSLQQRLLDPLLTGKLPDAQQKQIDEALRDAITSTKSRFAAMGMSGSSVEAAEIENLRNKSIVLSGTIAEQMAQTGMTAGQAAVSSLQLTGTIYEHLMNTQIQQDTALQNAIAAFAGQAAMAGAISTSKRA